MKRTDLPDCRPPYAVVLALAALAAPAAAQQPPSEETIEFFAQNCQSCHTIGGGALTGPDLKGSTERAEKDWLIDFILDPKGVIDSGDPYAVQLLRESRGVYMTQIPGMTRELAGKLVDLIEAESAAEKSRFSGLQISDRPLTEDDVTRGERLFRGADPYVNGAPACIACHTVEGIGGLGGGRLGPDLTSAYARLEGRKALAAWLSAPPSEVMAPTYRESPLDSEEVLALVAYLKDVAESGELEAEGRTLEFVLAGCGGAVVLLLLMDFLWRRRFRSVRRTLVTLRKRSPGVLK